MQNWWSLLSRGNLRCWIQESNHFFVKINFDPESGFWKDVTPAYMFKINFHEKNWHDFWIQHQKSLLDSRFHQFCIKFNFGNVSTETFDLLRTIRGCILCSYIAISSLWAIIVIIGVPRPSDHYFQSKTTKKQAKNILRFSKLDHIWRWKMFDP